MIPWMRSRIAEAWYNRKSSRTAERQSLAPSSTSTGNSESNKSMNLISSGPFFVKVISTNGFVLHMDVDMNTTIKMIKEVAIRHFHGMFHEISLFDKFRLVHANKLKQLADNKTVLDEEIAFRDELLLMPINSYFKAYRSSEENIRGPSIRDVEEATHNLPIRNPPKYIPPLYFSLVVETHKILLTLTYSSARLLMGSSEAPNLFQTIKSKYKKLCLPSISSEHLQTLTDIGYSTQQGIVALYVKKNNVTQALDWLIKHQEYPSEYFTISVILNLIAKKKGNEVDSNSPEIVQINFWNACNDLFSDGSTKYVEENLLNIVTVLIEYFRYIYKFNFKAEEELVNKFLEMGFQKKDIIEALKACGNDVFNACEWLLGNRELSLIDTNIGFSSNDLIYQAFMNNPQIQLNINNPNALLVFLKILDEPVISAEWISDPEIFPLIDQIFRTYHAEKRLHLS
ncbi:hypothetical protein M0804_007309 [Polistes exclamans]|nr:hypothetical protein M0804_007309 [Polistes exclamans]